MVYVSLQIIACFRSNRLSEPDIAAVVEVGRYCLGNVSPFFVFFSGGVIVVVEALVVVVAVVSVIVGVVVFDELCDTGTFPVVGVAAEEEEAVPFPVVFEFDLDLLSFSFEGGEVDDDPRLLLLLIL